MKFSVDWAQSGRHMVLPWRNIIARGSGCLQLDPADDVWVNELFHNVGGPIKTIDIVNMELVENAKVLKCEVTMHLFQASHEVERLIPRSLEKLAVIFVSILVVLFACIDLEEILTVINLRNTLQVCISITNRNFSDRMGLKNTQICSPYIAAALAFTHLERGLSHFDGLASRVKKYTTTNFRVKWYCLCPSKGRARSSTHP